METDTDLEGEVLSPTQPFPTKPPPFEYQGIGIDDLVDFTPEIRTMAVEAVRNFRLGPLFTPPMLTVEGGLQGTIQRPHIAGGASWGGAAADPETGLIYVPSVNSFSVIKYYTPDPAEGGNLRFTQADFDSGTQPTMPQGLPLLKPPYSRLTAIDLNAGEHAWMQPNGDGDRYRNHPMLRDLDLPPLGGEGPGRPGADEDAAYKRPVGRWLGRRPAPRGARQGDRRDRRIRRPSVRRHRHPDDLPVRRQAAHRADHRRGRAGADRARAAVSRCPVTTSKRPKRAV